MAGQDYKNAGFPLISISFSASPALYKVALYVAVSYACRTMLYFRHEEMGAIITSEEKNSAQMV